tara:strand:+ start:7182 stop:8453 length:1272 start_codon:yes stop_codon:yes gene_type:complete
MNLLKSLPVMGQFQSGIAQLGGISGLLNKGQMGLLKDIPLSPLLGDKVTAQMSAVLPEELMGTTPGMNIASDMSEQMMMEMGQSDPEAMTQKILADQGRYGDQVMGHLAPGEIVIPKKLAQDPELLQTLQEVYDKFGVDMNQYTVGNDANSINPNTGIMEFGFLSDLWGDIKKNAPTIGHIVGFAVAGPPGAAIGGAIGGAVKEGDLGYAAKQALTGYTLGSMAQGAGLQGGTLGSATPVGNLTTTGGVISDSIGQNFVLGPGGQGLVGAGPQLGFGAGGVTSGGVGGFLENLGANARGIFGTAGPGATGIGSAFQGLSGMEKAIVGLGAMGAMGGMKTPEQEEQERTLMQNPQILDYMNKGMGQAGSFDFPSGPQLARQSRNQAAGLIPLNAGIENSALLNYLESMRAQPVSQVVYPNFETV